jgi:hypothetical protein
MLELLVSTTGPSAVTVTSSLSDPTGRMMSSVTDASPETSMFSRTIVLNPESEVVTVYRPAGRLRNTYVPVADVVADFGPPSSAGLEISTVAPGITARSSCVTVPVSFPSWMACARAAVAHTPRKNSEQHKTAKNLLPVCVMRTSVSVG